MTIKTKIISAAALLGGIALAAGAANAYPARSATDLNVRSGPGTQYEVVDQLSSGERVNVNSCVGGWCRVSSSGGSGWVSSNYLIASNAPRYSGQYYDPPYRGPGYYNSGPTFYFGLGLNNGNRWHGYRHY